MKVRLVVLSLILLIVGSCNYSNNPHKSTLKSTKIYFENEAINMGKIKQNMPKVVVFKIENTGNNALLIQNVKTSCGCTVPQWTKKPIKPGKSGKIEVTYDAKYPGHFRKTITVFANVEDAPIELTLSGEVEFDETYLTIQ